MVPAQQRLKADDAAGIELQHGLVIDAKLPLGQRRPQIRLQPQPSYGASVHGFIENFATRSAQRLRAAHGHVGIFQYVFGALVR